jgi:CheY-like chemotaxis protein
MLEVALLQIPDLELMVASSAQAALQLLESDNAKIAALVTDLNMPRMDGFDLIAKVRSLPRHKHLPILVISGDTDLNTPTRLRSLGADAYLPKPYSPAEVRQTLERLLND